MLDQGGAYLHELTHPPNLVGVQGIRDGKYSKCYDWYVIEYLLYPFSFSEHSQSIFPS